MCSQHEAAARTRPPELAVLKAGGRAVATKKPNIVAIMTDDVGIWNAAPITAG